MDSKLKMWQYVKLCRSVPEIHFACFYGVKQPTNKPAEGKVACMRSSFCSVKSVQKEDWHLQCKVLDNIHNPLLHFRANVLFFSYDKYLLSSDIR